jgi:hypothetical protein
MDIKTAEALSLLMMRINANLDDSVAMVRDKGSAEELQWYRQEVGKKSQMRAVLSRDAVTTRLPSGLKLAKLTESPWACTAGYSPSALFLKRILELISGE